MPEDKPKWRRRKEARPAEIVDAALEVFAEKGFAAAKLDDIARKAGISKATLYLYFDTKEEIFRAVAQSAVASLLEALESQSEGTDAPFAELAPKLLLRAAEMMKGGRVPVEFSPDRNQAGVAFGEMTQPEPVFGALHDPATLAPLLGLNESDFAAQPLPQTVSTGLPYCVVVLRSVEALSRLRVDHVAGDKYLRASDTRFFYALAAEAPGVWRARMQFYSGEDPATGSAAGCAIAYLVNNEIVAPGAQLHLRQGVEMGRPSDLYVSANFHFGKVTEVRVGGSTVPVAIGRLFLE